MMATLRAQVSSSLACLGSPEVARIVGAHLPPLALDGLGVLFAQTSGFAIFGPEHGGAKIARNIIQ